MRPKADAHAGKPAPLPGRAGRQAGSCPPPHPLHGEREALVHHAAVGPLSCAIGIVWMGLVGRLDSRILWTRAVAGTCTVSSKAGLYLKVGWAGRPPAEMPAIHWEETPSTLAGGRQA